MSSFQILYHLLANEDNSQVYPKENGSDHYSKLDCIRSDGLWASGT